MSSKKYFFKSGHFKPDVLKETFASNSYAVNILKPFFHKAMNEGIYCVLFQVVSSFPVSESILQASSHALLGGNRRRETAGVMFSAEQGFLA